MGALTSRQHAGVEEVDIPSNSVYRYPPKSGSYFASHFIMGGEKFDSTHPEGYLFGENSDLNFLGNRPVAFPYAAPPPQEPVKTLRSLINIRKDTLRLVKCAEEVKSPGEEASKAKVHYNVEFTFDTDARVAITLYYQATEEFQNGIASYIPKDSSLQSETVHYKRGVCQQFCLPSHTVDPSEWAEEELGFDLDREVYPLVVHAVVDEGDGRVTPSILAVYSVLWPSPGRALAPEHHTFHVASGGPFCILSYLCSQAIGADVKSWVTCGDFRKFVEKWN